MKLYITILFSLLLLAACNNNTVKPAEEIAPPDPNIKTTTCYYGTMGKDSAYLQLVTMGTSVAGILNYIPYEKDKNTGTISGDLRGDTIVADYKFTGEGMESVRQVVLLRKGNTVTEGYGDVEDKDGKMVYKEINKITFSGMVLLEGYCGNGVKKK